MERDLELLENCSNPALRLYCWSHPTLSLGRNQRDDWVDYSKCNSWGVEVVRRPTGGRALLHLPSEVTYAVILPDIANMGISELFTSIAYTLALSLQKLGLPVETSGQGHIPGSHSAPSCLAVTAPGEVIARGRKLVGSAQVRKGERLLQHGVIVRSYNEQLLQAVIPGARAEMDLKTLGFESLEAKDIMESWQEVVRTCPRR